MFTAIKPDEVVASELGARVRMVRQARRLTQSQLADTLDVQRPWISRVESGKLSPSPGKLRALSLVLGVSVDALLGL